MNLDPIERWNLALCATAVAGGLALVSPRFAVGLAVGAALEAANFRGLWRSARFLFDGTIVGSRSWAAVFALRFLLLATGIGAALYLGVDAAGLVIGLSLVVPAALIAAWRSRPAIDVGAPALESDDPSWDRWNAWLAREDLQDDDPEESGE